MISAIFKRELVRQWRSRTLRILLPLSLVLAAAVAAVHWHQQQAFFATQGHWQEVNDELFRTQPDRHPHRVSHYGSLAFRFSSPLAFLDAGVNPYVGNVLFLEGHRQNSSGLRQFTVSARELGLGYLSVATLVLVLWPLVLVALAHGAVSDERANGNFNLLLSLGVRPLQFLAGQGLVFLLISAFYLAFLAVIAGAFVLASPVAADGDVWLRLGLGLLLYFGYWLVWILAILLVSYHSRSSARSLLFALGLWLLWVVLVPRTLTTVSEVAYPAPSRSAFDIQVENAIARIGDSHNPDDPYFNDFRKSVLDRYGVERVEDLPVNWRGIVMQEGERIGTVVFDEHYGQLIDTYRRQDRFYDWLSLVSPYALVARLSTEVTGTDAESYYDFERQAEAYRFGMISELNELHAGKLDYHTDKQTRLGSSHWEAFAPFEYRRPTLDLPPQRLALLAVAVLLWAAAAIVVFRRRTA